MDNLLRQIERAQSLGSYRAASQLDDYLRREIERCRSELECVADVLQQRACFQPLPTDSELYREILSLGDEFENMGCSLKASELHVVTEPVVLRGIRLGRFEIRLNWTRLADTPCYRVVALDPHPAASNSDVTHPHVQDEHLCEGDGRAAIQTALAEGRLADFFLIVARILGSYAKGSAYVELSDWQGTPCSDCGTSVCDDDRWECPQCDEVLCPDCGADCLVCGYRHCAGCLVTCPRCKRHCCGDCQRQCSHCKTMVCTNCWTDPLCSACKAQQLETKKHVQNSDTAGKPVAEGSRRRPARARAPRRRRADIAV